MNRRMLVVVAVLSGLVGSLLAQVCPEQFYTPIPADIDPNKIAVNPASGKRLLLQVVHLSLGQTMRCPIEICDPDGDAIEQPVADKGVITLSNGKYNWEWTPKAIGVDYLTVSVKDIRPLTHDPNTARGTIVTVTTPVNNAPRIRCGGLSQ